VSGISAQWLGYYPSQFVGASMAIPELGWHMARPPIERVYDVAMLHKGSFVDVRWIAAAANVTVANLVGRFRLLWRLELLEEIEVVDNIVAVAPATAAGWEAALEKVFAAVPSAAPVAYTRIVAKIGAGLSKTSVETCLQRLCDTNRLVGHTTPGTSDWATIAFSRPAAVGA
jgi:hypothetical protein